MRDLRFICPSCSGTELKEMQSTEVLSNVITRLDRQGGHDYGPTLSEGDGEVMFYRCSGCGYQIEDGDGHAVEDCVALAEWLARKPYNRQGRRNAEDQE